MRARYRRVALRAGDRSTVRTADCTAPARLRREGDGARAWNRAGVATASARTARSRTVRAPARPAPVRARPRAVDGRPVRGTIRWDRVGKLAVGSLLGFVLLLYVHPLLSIWSTRGDAEHRRADVVRLSAEQRRLHDRIAALRGDKALEQEARRLGMVRRGERAYVITNLGR